MVWEPKDCCCAGTLRTGTQILGWLGMIFPFLGVLSLFGLVGFGPDTFARICPDYECGYMYYKAFVGGVVFTAFILLLHVAICALLVYGVSKNKPVMMLPYLILQVIGIVLVGLSLLINFIWLAVMGVVAGVFIVLIFGGLVSFLQVYFFLVARACYLEVKQSSSGVSSDTNIAYENHSDDHVGKGDGYEVKFLS